MDETQAQLGDEKHLAIDLFNSTWALPESENRCGNSVAGNADEVRSWTEKAIAACAEIVDPETRTLLLSDLETIPGFEIR